VSTDLRERIDESFGDGPAHRPLEERLVAGRRAMRSRRRTALASSVTAVVASLGVALAFTRTDGGAGGGIGPDPPSPNITAAPIPVRLLVAPARFARAGAPPVLYLYGRMFKRERDETVLATYGEIDISTHPHGAAIVRADGRTVWVAVAGNEPHMLVEQREAPYDEEAFRVWAQFEVPVLAGRQALAATAPGGYRTPVPEGASPAQYSDGTLVAKPGGSVIQRIRRPVVNEAAVLRCHDQAVRVHTAGGDWFVLGYDCSNAPVLYSEPVGVRADSLATWLVRVHLAQDAYEY